MENMASLLASSKNTQQSYKPLILRLNVAADKAKFESLFADGKVSFVHDEMYGQLQELVQSEHPSIKIKEDESERAKRPTIKSPKTLIKKAPGAKKIN